MGSSEDVPVRPYIKAALAATVASVVLGFAVLVYSLPTWNRSDGGVMPGILLGTLLLLCGPAVSAYVQCERLRQRVLPDDDSTILDPSELDVRHRWMVDEHAFNRVAFNNPIALSVVAVYFLFFAPLGWPVSGMMWKKASRIEHDDPAGRTPDPSDERASPAPEIEGPVRH